MKRCAMFIHGFLTDKGDFGALKALLSPRYEEIFECEIPGHGSEPDYSRFTVDGTIEYVEEHFERLKNQYDEIDLYGYSMGGALCTHLASKGGVSNMLLFAPANKYLNPAYILSGFSLYFGKIKKTVKSAPREALHDEIAKEMDVYLQNAKISMDIGAKKLVPYYNKHTLLTFTRLIRKINAGLAPWDTRTCIFWGKIDQMVPETTIDFLSQYFLSARHFVKVYEDITHLMLNSKNAGTIVCDVVKFLDYKDEFSDEAFYAHKKESEEN